MKNLIVIMLCVVSVQILSGTPSAGDTVGSRPPIVVDSVEFAVVKKNGRIISPYGELIDRAKMGYLTFRIKYRTESSGGKYNLSARIINPKGDVPVSDINSNRSLAFSLASAPTAGEKENIGRWDLMPLPLGSCLEIYDGERKIYSVEIPLKARIMYKPIRVIAHRLPYPVYDVRTGTVSAFANVDESGRVIFNGRHFHVKVRPSIAYTVGDITFEMIEWVEIKE